MIYAKCIETTNPWGGNKYPLKKGKMYEVECINMGQSYTDVKLVGIKNPINSVCLEFYENSKEINIYSDKRFNPYL